MDLKTQILTTIGKLLRLGMGRGWTGPVFFYVVGGNGGQAAGRFTEAGEIEFRLKDTKFERPVTVVLTDAAGHGAAVKIASSEEVPASGEVPPTTPSYFN